MNLNSDLQSLKLRSFYLVFFPLSMAAFATRNNVLMGLWVILSAAYLTLHSQRHIKINSASALIAATCIAVTLVLPFAIYRSFTSAVHYYVCICTLVITYILSHDLKKFTLGVKSALFSLQIYTLFYFARFGISNYPLENIIPSSSSNGITSYLIIMQASFCALSYLTIKKIPVISPLVTLFICFIGFGRGSLVTAALIIAVNVFFYFTLTARRRVFTFLFTLTILPGAVVVLAEPISHFVTARTKMAAGLYDESRMRIHRDYFGKINPVTVITGASYEDTSITKNFNNNPHSSYIRAHHIFGLLYLVAVIFFCLLIVTSTAPRREKFYCLGMITVMLLRASTEPILFPTPLDIFYFGIPIAFLRKYPNSSNAKLALKTQPAYKH